jgi:hypothetical protein
MRFYPRPDIKEQGADQEGQGHSGDDDKYGIDIIALDNWHGMLH